MMWLHVLLVMGRLGVRVVIPVFVDHGAALMHLHWLTVLVHLDAADKVAMLVLDHLVSVLILGKRSSQTHCIKLLHKKSNLQQK